MTRACHAIFPCLRSMLIFLLPHPLPVIQMALMFKMASIVALLTYRIKFCKLFMPCLHETRLREVNVISQEKM